MDRAKEAYDKAERLERRLDGLSSGMTFSSLPDGGKLADLGAGALVFVTASLTGGGTVRLTLDDALVALLTAPGSPSAAVTAADGGELRITPDSGTVIDKVSVSVIGGADYAEDGGAGLLLRADESNGVVRAVVTGGETTVYVSDGGAFIPERRLGECTDADVVADGTAAFASGGRAYVTDGDKVRPLGRGRLVALCRDSYGLAAAVYDGEKVAVAALSDDLVPLRVCYCHATPTVSALAFVKGAEEARLVVCDNGRNVLRRVSRGGDVYRRVTVKAEVL